MYLAYSVCVPTYRYRLPEDESGSSFGCRSGISGSLDTEVMGVWSIMGFTFLRSKDGMDDYCFVKLQCMENETS